MKSIIDRMNENDPYLVRIDLTASLLEEMPPVVIEEFLNYFPRHPTIKSVHLSGLDLDSVLTDEQIEEMVVNGIGSMTQLEDLCVFRGGSPQLTEDVLGRCLHNNRSIKTLLLWQFSAYHEHLNLAMAFRQHPNLQRITLTLPSGMMPWACLDVYAMAFCEMPQLRVLQIRCHNGKQEDAIMSPEACKLLFSSLHITSLYLENCGLLDDHVDIMAEELPHNQALQLLDLKDNLLTDDALYTFARILPQLTTLQSLDVSGCTITAGAGEALAHGMARNTVLTHLELEGTEERFQDEFEIPVGHSQDPWMKAIYFQLRLNRAQENGTRNASDSKYNFVEALTSVSDQLECLYHFIRSYPQHCDRQGRNTIFYYDPILGLLSN